MLVPPRKPTNTGLSRRQLLATVGAAGVATMIPLTSISASPAQLKTAMEDTQTVIAAKAYDL